MGPVLSRSRLGACCRHCFVVLLIHRLTRPLREEAPADTARTHEYRSNSGAAPALTSTSARPAGETTLSGADAETASMPTGSQRSFTCTADPDADADDASDSSDESVGAKELDGTVDAMVAKAESRYAAICASLDALSNICMPAAATLDTPSAPSARDRLAEAISDQTVQIRESAQAMLTELSQHSYSLEHQMQLWRHRYEREKARSRTVSTSLSELAHAHRSLERRTSYLVRSSDALAPGALQSMFKDTAIAAHVDDVAEASNEQFFDADDARPSAPALQLPAT